MVSPSITLLTPKLDFGSSTPVFGVELVATKLASTLDVALLGVDTVVAPEVTTIELVAAKVEETTAGDDPKSLLTLAGLSIISTGASLLP